MYTQLICVIHSRNDLHHIFSYFIHIHSMNINHADYHSYELTNTFQRLNDSTNRAGRLITRLDNNFYNFFFISLATSISYTNTHNQDAQRSNNFFARILFFSLCILARDINMAEYQRNFCINLQIILYTSQKPLCIPSPTRRDETTDDISRLKKRRAYVHNPSLGFPGVEASCTQNWHASRVARKFSSRFQVDGHRGAVKGIRGAFWCKGK